MYWVLTGRCGVLCSEITHLARSMLVSSYSILHESIVSMRLWCLSLCHGLAFVGAQWLLPRERVRLPCNYVFAATNLQRPTVFFPKIVAVTSDSNNCLMDSAACKTCPATPDLSRSVKSIFPTNSTTYINITYLYNFSYLVFSDIDPLIESDNYFSWQLVYSCGTIIFDAEQILSMIH